MTKAEDVKQAAAGRTFMIQPPEGDHKARAKGPGSDTHAPASQD